MKSSNCIKIALVMSCLFVQSLYTIPAMAYSYHPDPKPTAYDEKQDDKIGDIEKDLDHKASKKDVSDEEQRAKGAEHSLKHDISHESYERWTADRKEAFTRWLADKYEEYQRIAGDQWLNCKINRESNERIAMDNYLDNRITSESLRLDGRIDNLSSRVDKVGALAAASAGLAPMAYDPQAPTQFAVGSGTYAGETAIAVGFYHYPNKDLLLNAGWSFSGSENMGHVGATWKIGGPKAQKTSAEPSIATMAPAATQNEQSIIDRTNSILNSNNQ